MASVADNNVLVVASKPFNDQAPGTSGLRKKTKVFTQDHYLENFIQSIFDVLPPAELKGSTLVVSGDGRYFNKPAASTILRMAAANGVGKVLVGENYLMATPAVSAVIRAHKAYGGIVLTASHNPGGPENDFGVKYNTSNGGPAPEKLTGAIFERTKVISSYRIWKEQITFDVSKQGEFTLGPMKVQVLDPAEDYVKLLKTIFDFEAIKKLLHRNDFSFVYDAMHGVAGPYAHRVFCKELGAPASALMNAVPLEDFGGGHPDPNLTYAAELVARMGLPPAAASAGAGDHGHSHGPGGHAHGHEHKKQNITMPVPQFGAAGDGDMDRNMILGKRFFVTPSDSVAIIAAYAKVAIPFFIKHGLAGVARSMPTSQALDRVAAKLGVTCYEVPTGWKFFGNLMDAGRLSICGEESFGTGADHVREKDGLWAVLAWLSILQYRNQDSSQPFVSVQNIVEEHWKTYGRNYYCRYDYENVDADKAKNLMKALRDHIANHTLDGVVKQATNAYTLATADDFSYTDPIDHSVSAGQGIRVLFADGSRFVFRLSGTGSVGATIRLYVEKYETAADRLTLASQDALAPLIRLALTVSSIKQFIGTEEPTVIT